MRRRNRKWGRIEKAARRAYERHPLAVEAAVMAVTFPLFYLGLCAALAL